VSISEEVPQQELKPDAKDEKPKLEVKVKKPTPDEKGENFKPEAKVEKPEPDAKDEKPKHEAKVEKLKTSPDDLHYSEMTTYTRDTVMPEVKRNEDLCKIGTVELDLDGSKVQVTGPMKDGKLYGKGEYKYPGYKIEANFIDNVQVGLRIERRDELVVIYEMLDKSHGKGTSYTEYDIRNLVCRDGTEIASKFVKDHEAFYTIDGDILKADSPVWKAFVERNDGKQW